MCAGMALTYYDFLTIQDMFSFNNSVNEKNLCEAYCTIFFSLRSNGCMIYYSD